MLTRSARRLLGRTCSIAKYQNEDFSKFVDNSGAHHSHRKGPALTELCKFTGLDGECSGFQNDILKRGISCGHRVFSTTGFRVLDPLQQGMSEMMADLAPLPSDIRYEDLVITRSKHLQVKPKLDATTLKFGAVYSDHMLQASWKDGLGWTAPSIDPLGPISLHPCAQVLHYAVECFEGMKCYKGKDGRLRLFRPDMNMDRLARSAARLTLPHFDKVELLECIKELLRVERDWVPDKEGFSVYIRPTMIGTHPFLGVGPTREALLFVVLSPVGPYFPSGLKPIKLYVETQNVRAFPGGVGDKKIGGNYAPTILPQLNGSHLGCSQVLFVLQDGNSTGGLVGESGSMNMFFLIRQEGKDGDLELVTPPLDGLILPGVTRDTVLTLARGFGGMKVSERPLRFDELERAAETGRLLEVFGTGTACMIQPVMGLVKKDHTEIAIPFNEEAAKYWLAKPPGIAALPDLSGGEPFSLCGRLSRALLDVQYGYIDSQWSIMVDP
ncbi:uncharacterized protein [Physcomitrium patens]|uniref:branched-chain-amino-acid transaminase n=1 Tax=Physcomitrium patens TaxID=3218 RepID=A0A7I4B8Z3_PHYPA|nr:branched-chain-amino-acid aminotransferase, cytosolic-like [Physcomitrium patens]XP_024401550.1 branched-chain-amino-acid aminotransferase, cytosolic-like [Physcomitrium patens]|eukprot:XP_024401549.1 branched-chain-amino-acid aminotransferase, cytosolic-like [Physcomitrella patens]